MKPPRTMKTASGVIVRKHPRNCHKCIYNGRNAPGLPHDPEAAAACLDCARRKDIPLSHKGVSWIAFEAADNPATVWAHASPDALAMRDTSAPGGVTALPFASEEGLKWTLCEISALAGTPELAITFGLFHRFTFAAIAKECGLSVRITRQRWRDLLKANPHICALYRLARTFGADGVPGVHDTEPPGGNSGFRAWSVCKRANYQPPRHRAKA